MKIGDIQKSIEESLANLPAVVLPSELDGLRHLPLEQHNPQVHIRYLSSQRKVREDAASAYFDPDRCELIVRFIPLEAVSDESDVVPDQTHQAGAADEANWERLLDQLIDELKRVEQEMPFVGLKWFRDQFLLGCGKYWARDPRKNGALLRRATDQRLVLTSQVPNPEQPMHPVTAIRVNRAHPRLQIGVPAGRSEFRPLPIGGGPVSDTVINDRR